MTINRKRMQLLVISPPNGCNTRALILVGDEEIHSQPKLKLVGFTFCEKPDARAHVLQIKERFRLRVWMLLHLRRAGFKGRQRYRLYCCYLRTVVEYCSVVYHSLLTAGQSEDLERTHRQAVRICYGTAELVQNVMATDGIETLEARRTRRCDGFIRKASLNPNFAGRWFKGRPDNGHDLRRSREIFEPRASTARWFKSPLSFLRRRANQLGIGGVRKDNGHQETRSQGTEGHRPVVMVVEHGRCGVKIDKDAFFLTMCLCFCLLCSYSAAVVKGKKKIRIQEDARRCERKY